ncbi:MAG: diaminopimelate decarboxylase [Cytophagaceae bacterium]|nr:diaminopimelate decarboxylase [Cytophagaceae bacterium]MDW8457046.1 diaminopimelate decarboxylase [Cytophagaceae bacterium]
MQITSEEKRIQGISFSEIAEKFGTPTYVYDTDVIRNQYRKLKEAFKDINIKIKYAAKALTNQAILKVLLKEGSGIDVVSLQEVELALKAGYKPSEIMFTPNGVSFYEIEKAVEYGVVVNIDNLPTLQKFGARYGSSYNCCVRINPHVKAGGNEKIMTGHRESKFGISIEQVNELYQTVHEYNIQVAGVHVHTGSDIKNIDAFIETMQSLFEVAKNFKNLSFLDFGSGFKVAYSDDDVATDIYELGKKLSEEVKEFINVYGRQLEIWIEPGKFLVSECGYLLVKAELIKPTPACCFVFVNSGLNHLIRPMMYGAYHKITNVTNPKGIPTLYNVVGYICETDTFAGNIYIAEVREGDLLIIHNAGAYGFSMSSNYNSRFRPAEVMIHEKKPYLIRRRETIEDLLRNQIDVDL